MVNATQPAELNLPVEIGLSSTQTVMELTESSSFVLFYDSMSRLPFSAYLASFGPLSILLLSAVITSEATLTFLTWRDYQQLSESEKAAQKADKQLITAKSALMIAGSIAGIAAGLICSTILTLASPMLFIAGLAVLAGAEAKACYHLFKELKSHQFLREDRKVKQSQLCYHTFKCVLFIAFIPISGFALIAGAKVALAIGAFASFFLVGVGLYDGTKRYQAIKQKREGSSTALPRANSNESFRSARTSSNSFFSCASDDDKKPMENEEGTPPRDSQPTNLLPQQ